MSEEKIKKEKKEIRLEDYIKDHDVQNAFALIANMTFTVKEAEKNLVAKRICTQLEMYMTEKAKEEKEKELEN